MKKLEKIIKYLDNEVTDEERQLLETDIASDKELFQTFLLVQEVDEVINDPELIQFVNTIESIHAEQKNKNRFLRRSFFVAASVTILLVASALLYYSTPSSNEKLYAQFYNKYEACYTTRGNTEINDLITAIQLYDKKEYSSAILRFSNIIKNNKKNTAAHFFIGASFMEINKFNLAIEHLGTVIELKDTAFLEHAQWYLALCYLKINRSNQAKLLIRQIAIGDSYYRSMALELSKKMK